jgi:hypothetical protein
VPAGSDEARRVPARPAEVALQEAGTPDRFPTWARAIVVFVIGAVVLVAAAVSTTVIIGGILSDSGTPRNVQATGADPVMVVPVPPVSGHDVEVGVCIDDDEFDKKLTDEAYTLTSCAEPHDNEVYFIYEFPAGPYPGEDGVSAEMSTRCDDAFWPYVGDGYDPDAGSAGLSTSNWWPTESGWESGYRTGTCMIEATDGTKLTGSLHWGTGKELRRPDSKRDIQQ